MGSTLDRSGGLFQDFPSQAWDGWVLRSPLSKEVRPSMNQCPSSREAGPVQLLEVQSGIFPEDAEK